MKRWCAWPARLVLALGLLALLLGFYLAWPTHPPSVPPRQRVPVLSHVFLVVMENHAPNTLTGANTPYIHHLMQADGYDAAYYGVTHVSLPNYLALLAGRTFGTHSDNPDQTFSGPTLAEELNRRHISWEAVMQSLPYRGYSGNWYPEPRGQNPTVMPINALYAKKHDPFMLFTSVRQHDASHVVPLRILVRELHTGQVPRFVWITPNLCDDMHGQPPGSRSCPSNRPALAARDGDRFLRWLVPQITHSSAFRGHSVLFITWDEANMPSSLWNLAAWKRWLSWGPLAPRILGIPVGGGPVPLIAIIPGRRQPPHVHLWADHYNLLKTIEAGFRLPYLGHTRSPAVTLLTPLLTPRR
ncbi:MAG: phosphoesterase [Firmicutes bacterium]|nr:phosphoesterase [Bacillota bacterium]